MHHWNVFKVIMKYLKYLIREEVHKATGGHFNLPGHKMSDMSVSVLEKVKEKNIFYREGRESYHIENFNLQRKGINRKRWNFANCNQKIFQWSWVLLGTENVFYIYQLLWSFTYWWWCCKNTEIYLSIKSLQFMYVNSESIFIHFIKFDKVYVKKSHAHRRQSSS